MKKAKKYKHSHHRSGFCLNYRYEEGASFEWVEAGFCKNISGRLFKKLCRAAGIANGRAAYQAPLIKWAEKGVLRQRVVSWRERFDLPPGTKIVVFRCI